MEERLLWQPGDEKAFQLLFREYYPQLFLYGFKIMPQKQVLEDIIQELFTELWNRKTVPEVRSLKAYLIKSLQYKIYNKLRQQKTTAAINEATSEFSFEINRETLLIQREEDREKAVQIEKMLAQLSHRQREIIYLRFYQDLDYEEISEAMQINYQASRNLLSQAIKILRQLKTPTTLLFALIIACVKIFLR
jgi:RNA polymerase sigma-70 factor (ECF subfamily)